MEARINSFFEYIRQAAIPILIMVFVFFVTVFIRMVQEERKDSYFDESKFLKKNFVAHGMACVFAIIYLNILYFNTENTSSAFAILMLIVFYGFAEKIVITQNTENGGYIETYDDASGVIMYVTSVLSPIVFVVIHSLLGGIYFWLYKRNENDEFFWKKIIRRVIDCGESLIVVIIAKVFIPHTFIQNLWINSIIIDVFTLAIPFLNDWLYKRFSLE